MDLHTKVSLVEVSEDVAEAIEAYMDMITRQMGRTDEVGKGIFVAEHCQQDWRLYEDGQYAALNNISTYDLMRVLVLGYIVK